MNILERIDELRKERGWSVNYLAMEAELTQSTLNNLYIRKTDPKISTLRAICDAFGITLAEFFREERDPDAEIKRRVASLSSDEKRALLTILRSMRG